MLALFTMDSARLDSIILTMLFSGYNIETVHWSVSLLSCSHCAGWLWLCWAGWHAATSSLRPAEVRRG